jgi:hypothetical protein
MLKRISLLPTKLTLLFSLLLVIAPLMLPQAIQAEGNRTFVSGTMIVNDQPTNCNSPIGICLSGTVMGKQLNGTISGQSNTIKEVDDKQGNPIAYILTGVATITTSRGTLNANAYFYQNYPALTGYGTLTITGGTKRYKNASGIITMNEPIPPTCFPSCPQTFYYFGWLNSKDGDGND